MRAQTELKKMEHMLLHGKINNIENHAYQAKQAIDLTMAWVATHTKPGRGDVLPVLESVLDEMSNVDRRYMLAAIQEIKQLRGEKRFWASRAEQK